MDQTIRCFFQNSTFGKFLRKSIRVKRFPSTSIHNRYVKYQLSRMEIRERKVWLENSLALDGTKAAKQRERRRNRKDCITDRDRVYTDGIRSRDRVKCKTTSHGSSSVSTSVFHNSDSAIRNARVLTGYSQAVSRRFPAGEWKRRHPVNLQFFFSFFSLFVSRHADFWRFYGDGDGFQF